jgi:maleate cis-trans isomerase
MMAFKSWRGDVGVIKPTHRPGSLEEFIRLVPEGIGIIPLFLGITRGTVDEFTEAIDAYEEKIAELAALEVDLIHPEGAPPFIIQGYEGERKLIDGWERKYGIPMMTSGQVQVDALRALDVTRVVVSSYTNEGTNKMVSKYLTEAGFDVLENAGIDVPFEQAGNLSHHQVYRHTKAAAQRHPEADGILLFGSGWRSLDAIELLEQDLEIPVAHPVPARVWTVQKRLRVVEPVSGYGRLLEEMP